MNCKNTISIDTSKKHIAKYTNKNPIHRFTLGRFFDLVAQEIASMNVKQVLEFGCGEGLFLQELKKRNIIFNHLTGIDLRIRALQHAAIMHPEYSFLSADIMKSPFRCGQFDFVIASQVLEHVYHPDDVLKKLVSLCSAHLFLTVPWEPWFCLMNLLRGRDIKHFGNHPEHVNHWSLNKFKEFVASCTVVEKYFTVFPFIIVKAHVN